MASDILEELRLLAHGIHPGILTGAGLEEALERYAATVMPRPSLTFDLGGRLPQGTEAALYAIVTGLVEATSGANLSIRRDAERVTVRVAGSGEAPEHVLDRVGAAGGSSARTDNALELSVPCV